MQPGLIRTQLRGLLKSIKSASHATRDDPSAKEANKVNLWCYGAGGAYCLPTDNPAGGPGKVWDIKGSIYVGVERDKGAEARRKGGNTLGTVSLYSGEISYCSESTQETLYTSPTYYFTEQARNDVQKKFLNPGDLLEKQIKLVQSNTGKGETKPANRGGISITANTFIGGDIKEAARKFYELRGEVNMEDYHLLKLIYSIKSSQKNFTSVKSIENQYPFLNKVRIIRIDADPATIQKLADSNTKNDPAKYTKFGEANPKEINVQEYAEIIRWGMMGMEFDKIPDSINWKEIENFIKTKGNIDDYLVTCKSKYNEEICVNPFLLEAAQDMFREVGEWLRKVERYQSDTEEGYDSAIKRNPFNKTKNLGTYNQMKDLLNAYTELNKKLSEFCNGKKDSITETACEEFITNLYKFLMDTPDIKTETKVNIWVRGGWGATGTNAFFVENLNYSGAIVDRALYKSTNTTVLANHAKDAVTNYFT